MPFNTPYKGYYTKGDLIYGLATTRKKLMLYLGGAILSDGGGAALTVDQYKKSQVELGKSRSTDRKERQIALKEEMARRETLKKFLSDNESHKDYSGYRRAIRGHNDDEDKFAEQTLQADLTNAAWRAKSKFGLEWTLKGSRGHIHFVLDDIDMAAVATKTHTFTDPGSGDVKARDFPQGKAQPDARNKERTITHSELRWIYRNRTNPLVSDGIQFWLSVNENIAVCGPPWGNSTKTTAMPDGAVKTWAQAWADYVPTTTHNTF